MKHNLLYAALFLASASHAGTITVNGSCVVTPTSDITIAQVTGNMSLNGTLAGCGGSPATTPPTFSLNPNPTNLTVSGTPTSAGGIVNPDFIAYFTNLCSGHLTQTTGCTAVGGAWGTGGAVCNGQTNPDGQLYCSPHAAAVTLPPNTSTSTACIYTFQAVNCTNGATTISSIPVNVTVPASSGSGCVPGPSGDLGALGYSRACTGSVHSLNTSLHPVWNNTYTSLLSGAWPGSNAQFGWGLQITVAANGFGSFKFNTGNTVAGVSFESNTSYGNAGTMSVSTVPGDTFSGTAICAGQVVRPSTKPGTLGHCQLQLNTDYYLNVSMANYFAPHDTMCTAASCTTGWTVYSYGN